MTNTIPTLTEIMDAIFPDAPVGFVPPHYPYTYAYSFLQKHFNQVVPTTVRSAIEDPDLSSTAEIARFLNDWAALEGLEDSRGIATLYADAYLLESSIAKPAEVLVS